jgi:2-keto-4-pentenoate hydratase/2-oxohepta-3-ene-1,7-dioic acid hydratase in catechol pathway
MDAVWGFAVANDVTARDVQRASTTWDLAKGFDTFGPIGPWLTSADEVADWRALELRCLINGVLVQQAHAGDMTFGIPELIAFISRSVTLMPGDVILTGTPAGVRAGKGQEKDRLSDGDLMHCEVDGLGALSNQVKMTEPLSR